MTTLILNEQEIKIEDQHFQISEDNIDAELCASGSLIRYYGELSAEFMVLSQRLKEKRDREAASISIEARKRIEDEGRRPTEAIIKEIVLVDSNYIKAQEEYYNAERNHKKAESYYRAQQKKADAVRTLAYKQGYEIAKNAF